MENSNEYKFTSLYKKILHSSFVLSKEQVETTFIAWIIYCKDVYRCIENKNTVLMGQKEDTVLLFHVP